MIDVKGLTATLSTGENILTDISFILPKGAKLAIIGANGSGKSTLLKSLLGLIPSYFDHYLIDENSFLHIPLSKRAKLISYISQQQLPTGEITVWEWCELGRYTHHVSQQKNAQIIEKALGMTSTLSLAPRMLSSLSGGERQRVHMAGAIAQETPIVMLDEVNAALDPKHRDEMNRLIAALPEKTVISITHDINMLDCYTHLLALKAGKMVAFGEISSILNPTLLEDLFEYQFQELWHSGRARYF